MSFVKKLFFFRNNVLFTSVASELIFFVNNMVWSINSQWLKLVTKPLFIFFTKTNQAMLIKIEIPKCGLVIVIVRI